MEYLTDDIIDFIHLALKTSKVTAAFINQLDKKIIELGQPISQNQTKMQINGDNVLINEVIDRSGIDKNNIPALKDFLSSLRQYLINVSTVELDLPFEASDEFSERLFEWFTNNGFRRFIVHTKVNPEINSGLHLTWAGRFINLDMESVLERNFIDNKDVYERILHK